MTCIRCGKVARRDGAMGTTAEGTQCLSKAACKKRRDRKAPGWPISWERMMST